MHIVSSVIWVNSERLVWADMSNGWITYCMATGLWSTTDLRSRTISWSLESLCSRLRMAESSENLKTRCPEWLFVQWFVDSVKRTGELTQPCWAPVLIDLHSERVLLTLTFWLQLVKKEKYHLIKKGLTVICLNFEMSRWCWSVLKAKNCTLRGFFCLFFSPQDLVG